MSHYIDPRGDRLDHETLHVISVISNPKRYHSRYRLFQEFKDRISLTPQVNHITVEAAFGERDHAITDYDNHCHIQVRTSHELWLKENLINIGISRLPSDWKYVAWVDADVLFANPYWATDTLHALQHHPVVQMWSEAQDLSPKYEVIRHFKSFMWCYHNETSIPGCTDYTSFRLGARSYYWHPGYAWAARRDAINQLGGLIDWAILGGADQFMARALIGRLDRDMPKSLGKTGIRWLKEWERRAETYIKRDVGYINGLLLHFWHGKKRDRKYKDRGQILVNAHFDPEKDLWRDWQGCWQLNPDNIALRDGIREYLAQRNEDSIDLD